MTLLSNYIALALPLLIAINLLLRLVASLLTTPHPAWPNNQVAYSNPLL
ncbi:hypothetical protein [Hymenobacter wooponensis]|nr:hypothetical protein [Hymenobacter wooponensis]